MTYLFAEVTYHLSSSLMVLLGLLAVWELIFKGWGLWRAAQHRQKYWFIAILIINSVGILPII